MESQYEIRVYGRVQGVGFRSAARNMARSLQLRGWVENRPDRSVRALVAGDEEACMRFINWCRTGTGFSWVENIKIQKMKPEAQGPFTIRY
jgi:acylphosphatase